MVVYADVLIVLNLIVDYFLLTLTGRFLRRGPRLWRLLLAAVLGGLSSLYIFLPQSPLLIELAVRLGICAGLTAVCFGFGSARLYFRAMAVFFAVSCGYAGGMIALWYLLRPEGLTINNSVVYLDISPMFLIIFSVAGYFLSLFLRAALGRRAATAETCEIEVFADGRSTRLLAIADTGNSLEDVFGTSDIIIADEEAVRGLLGDLEHDAALRRRYRALPCTTVAGDDLLNGWRCDRAFVTCGDRTTELRRPVLAVSKTPLRGDYTAVVNPDILD